MVNVLRKCTKKDVDVLCRFAAETYSDTFSPLNSAENMELYLNTAFSQNKLLSELQNSSSEFYFSYSDGTLSGYLKINDTSAQTDLHDELSLEIERIYVAEAFQKKGVGKFLLEHAINSARQKQKKYIWLGVWEKNERALRFYEQNGFYRIGTHCFILGKDRQTDHIMRKDL